MARVVVVYDSDGDDDDDNNDDSDDGGDVDPGSVSLLKSKIRSKIRIIILGFFVEKRKLYPKRDYFSFISISTVSRRKNNTAADNLFASLLIFHCILDG